MRHDCDCEHPSTNPLDHVWTGDEIIPWALDYLPSHNRLDNNSSKEATSSGSFQKHNWNMDLHAFFSKAFRIAIALPIVGFVISAILVIIYMLV